MKACAVAIVGVFAWPLAQAAPCAGGWLATQAMVTNIQPHGTTVAVRRGGGETVPAAIGTVLCSGDTVVFAMPREGGAIELYQAGQFRSIRAEAGAETIGGGAGTVLDAAAAYLNAVFASGLTAPLRARPTAVRGAEGKLGDGTVQIRPILPLRDLPHQLVVPGTPLLVGWRDGDSPYRCEASQDKQIVSWVGPGDERGRCAIPAQLRGISAVTVRERNGRGASWYLQPVAMQAVPRPDWWSDRMDAGGTAERTAWAIWLWQQDDARWRLQALSMLAGEAPRSFVAGYVVEQIMAENPPDRPIGVPAR